nr:helix-turn-helix transcriptional regulator [Terrimonas ginsenosidimutans]
MYLNANIKFLRQYSQLTQAAFGELFGKSRTNIDGWERGKAKPDEAFQLALAKHFNISMETLLQKNLNANPGLLKGDQKENDTIKAKDELIKILREQVKKLEAQNDALLSKLLSDEK